MTLGMASFPQLPKKLPGGNGYASVGGAAHSITALWLWWFLLGSEPGTNSLRKRVVLGGVWICLVSFNVMTHMVDASEG